MTHFAGFYRTPWGDQIVVRRVGQKRYQFGVYGKFLSAARLHFLVQTGHLIPETLWVPRGL